MRAICFRMRFIAVAAILLGGAACSSAELPTQPDLQHSSSVAPTGFGTTTEQTGGETGEPPADDRGTIVIVSGG